MMEKQESLSSSQKQQAREVYLKFTSANAVSVACQMEGVLLLFALTVGLPKSLVGVLAAFAYVCLPLGLVGKVLIARKGLAWTASRMWWTRSVFAVMFALSPIAGEYFGLEAAISLLLTGAFGFFVCRGIGITAFGTIVMEITSEDNRGSFVSQLFMRTNLVLLAAYGVIVLLVNFRGHMGLGDSTMFQCIILVGCVSGWFAGWHISRMPESPSARQSAREPIFTSLGSFMSNSRSRKMFMAFIAGYAIVAIVVPQSMAALKKGYDMGYEIAIRYVLVQVVGGILISFLGKIVAEHTGARPVLIIYGCGMFVVSALWAFAPMEYHWWYMMPVFLLCGICQMGIIMGLAHYLLLVVGEKDRVMSCMLTNIAGGLGGAIASIAVGSVVIGLLERWGYSGIDLYRQYFFIVPAIIVVLLFVCVRLERVRDLDVKKTMGLLLSPRDLRVLVAVNRLEGGGSGINVDKRSLDTLEKNPSNHSEGALVKLLDSPKFDIRARALTAFRNAGIEEDGQNAIIEEVRRGEFTTAYIAADIIGQRGIHEGVDVLREALHSEDVFLKSKAMTSLMKLQDAESYERIIAIFRATDNPRLLIHGAAAIAEMGDVANLEHLLARSVSPKVKEAARHELLYYAAELIGCGDQLYKFIKTYHKNAEDGLSLLASHPDEWRGDAKRDSRNGPGKSSRPESSSDLNTSSNDSSDTKFNSASPFPLEGVMQGRISLAEIRGELRVRFGQRAGDEPACATVLSLLEAVDESLLYPELIYGLWVIADHLGC